MITGKNIVKRFDDFTALDFLSINIPDASVYGLVGPNGAGKTTLFHVIGGNLAPDTGKVFLNGTDVTGLPPYKIARRHVGRLFQDVRVFPDLSVIDNVQVSFLHRSDFKLSTTLAWWRRAAREQDRRERAMKWLEFVGLADKADEPAGELSFGQQKLLALARLAALRPALLLLDEPTASLDLTAKEDILGYFMSFRRKGGAVVLVTHDAEEIALSSECYLLKNGVLTKYDYDGDTRRLVGSFRD